MSDFILSVEGQEKTEEAIKVFIRATGFGAKDGPLMSRAKARAIVAAGIGPQAARDKRITDIEGKFSLSSEVKTATRDETLFDGPLSGVRDRVKTFRREGLLAEVVNIKELKTERVVDESALRDKFPENMLDIINTYEYEILVRTGMTFS